MPIYEYQCTKCQKHHEIMQKITDQQLTVCPDCGGALKKLISSTSFVLKGSGWYVTDYGDKNRSSSSKEPKEPSEKAETTEKKETPKEKTETASGEKPAKEPKADTKPAKTTE